MQQWTLLQSGRITGNPEVIAGSVSGNAHLVIHARFVAAIAIAGRP
jgi:hypothetical protein